MADWDKNKVEFTRIELNKVEHGIKQQLLGLPANDDGYTFQVEFHVFVFGVVKTHAVLHFASGIFLGGHTQGQLGSATGLGGLLDLLGGGRG
jgi:hypothetical protein